MLVWFEEYFYLCYLLLVLKYLLSDKGLIDLFGKVFLIVKEGKVVLVVFDVVIDELLLLVSIVLLLLMEMVWFVIDFVVFFVWFLLLLDGVVLFVGNWIVC